MARSLFFTHLCVRPTTQCAAKALRTVKASRCLMVSFLFSSFDGHNLLNAACLKNAHNCILLTQLDHVNDFLGHLFILFCGGRTAWYLDGGQEDVVFGLTALQQEGDLTSDRICSQCLELEALDEWDGHVVRAWAKVLVFLGREDVNGDNVRLCVPMLAGLGCCDLSNLDWVPLDHAVAALTQFSCCHGVGVRAAGISGAEVMLLVNVTHVVLGFDCCLRANKTRATESL